MLNTRLAEQHSGSTKKCNIGDHFCLNSSLHYAGFAFARFTVTRVGGLQKNTASKCFVMSEKFVIGSLEKPDELSSYVALLNISSAA